MPGLETVKATSTATANIRGSTTRDFFDSQLNHRRKRLRLEKEQQQQDLARNFSSTRQQSDNLSGKECNRQGSKSRNNSMQQQQQQERTSRGPRSRTASDFGRADQATPSISVFFEKLRTSNADTKLTPIVGDNLKPKLTDSYTINSGGQLSALKIQTLDTLLSFISA